MSTSTLNNHLNPNTYTYAPETVQYRLQLSYLLAPLSKGQLATQPHLIDSETISTSPDSSNTKLACPACQAALIVGVNATVRTHRNRLWRRCLGCRSVSKHEGAEGKGRGKERFPSVKQRHKMEKAAVLNRTMSTKDTSSRKLMKAVSDLARTNVPGDAIQGLESTTSTNQTALSRAVPISAPSSVPSPTPPSKPNFPSKPVPLNSEPRARPSSHTKSTTTTTTTTPQNQVKSTKKRSKTTTSGLAQLLAAKKLERESANQAGGTTGGMGLQQFLQSI